MKIRSPLLYFLLATVLITTLAIPVSVSAQENGFTESFEDPALQGWEVHPEATQIVDGTLQISPGGYALHFGDWSDITLTIRVSFSSESEAVIGYYFRENARYILTLSVGSLTLNKEQEQTGLLLGEVEDTNLQPNTWYTLTLVVAGDQHQVQIDNELVITVTDPQPLETGAVMLTSRGGGSVSFDDLNVRGTPVGDAPRGEEQPPSESPRADLQAEATPPSGSARDQFDFIEGFFSNQASRIELTDFIINLLLAAVCAWILGVVYTHWGASLSNRRKFAANFLLMTITTTFIIMVVRSSVALSLGLVGALSIVRFRSAVKEPEELAYLFFALGIGIGLGDNQRLITLVAMAAGIALLGLRHLLRHPDADINMHITIASRSPAEVTLEQINTTLDQHCSKIKLIRFDETAAGMEVAYLVELRRSEQLNQVRAALRSISPTLDITFMDNKGIW